MVNTSNSNLMFISTLISESPSGEGVMEWNLQFVCLLALPATFVRLLWVSPDSLVHASFGEVRVRGGMGRGREGEGGEGRSDDMYMLI